MGRPVRVVEVFRTGEDSAYGWGYLLPWSHPLSPQVGISIGDGETAFVHRLDVDTWKEGKRFSDSEFAAEMWRLEYEERYCWSEIGEWTTEVERSWDGTPGPNAVRAIQGWADKAREYRRQLDLLQRFAYSDGYDEL